ncbi:MAG: tetratricopeptide repeat protein [Blastocatellia bacterium]|nr:tetratricopeptide repeat protein [Blastocatellia bacterium]
MKILFLAVAALVAAGCSAGASPVSNAPADSGSDAPLRAEKMQSTLDRTLENQPPRAAASPNGGGKWTQSGDPIDTKEFDAAIAKANKDLKARPDDATAKASAVEAYFSRGFALTEARQYASALGDYRRALKLDPDHAESQKWEQQIIGIYTMMKKDYPKEGEEPPPLPFKES